MSSLTQLTAETTNGTHSISTSSGSSPSSAAVAMALAETSQPINIESAEMHQLGPNPTEQELLEYAKAHPAVRAAVKVFRGKIVKVKKTS